MIYNFLLPYIHSSHLANLLHYVSFRSFLAFIFSFIIWLIFGQKFISIMAHWQKYGQPIRALGPQSHSVKIGTPTMGGILMIVSIAFTTIVFCDLTNIYIWCSLAILAIFGILGFVDDYSKIKANTHYGIKPKHKLIVQLGASLIASAIIVLTIPRGGELLFPFVKNVALNLGYFYILFASFVIIGASNAVNLTDGLDGLASILLAISFGCFAVICYFSGNLFYAKYLIITHVIGAEELTILCSAVIGTCLGFLWFNCQPAAIFMGDTGSLALGGLLGVVSVIVKHEIMLAIIGGVFVLETLSVIIQVYYFKYSKGKRIFKMAPLHHHFEQSGWPESKVVIRFTIIAAVLAVVGLLSLKLR
jgi:phospho-N-acetylmuramoyl-pentapeptide-transferase